MPFNPDFKAIDFAVQRLEFLPLFFYVDVFLLFLGEDVEGDVQVVVVVLDLLEGDCTVEAVFFLEGVVGAGNGLDVLVAEAVELADFGVLFELVGGVDEKYLALPVGGLVFVQNEDSPGGAGVIEELLRKEDHTLEEILFQGSRADGLLLAAAEKATVVNHYPQPLRGGGKHVLDPCPVSGLFGNEAEGEALAPELPLLECFL